MSFHHPRPKLVTFDLDGTLVDTGLEIAEAVNACLLQFGLERRDSQSVIRLIGAGTRELMKQILANCTLAEQVTVQQAGHAAIFAAFDSSYEKTVGTVARAYPDCAQTLSRLQQSGIGLACLTNKEYRYAIKVLERLGLSRYFELVIGGDSLPFKKPDARVLQEVMGHFEVAPVDCLHVGDSAIDVQTARNAGVLAWAVSYGYNSGRPIAESDPDRCFSSLGTIADAILETRT